MFKEVKDFPRNLIASMEAFTSLNIALLTVQLVPRGSWEFAKRVTSDHLTHLQAIE
jgi:hypothetical protein